MSAADPASVWLNDMHLQIAAPGPCGPHAWFDSGSRSRRDGVVGAEHANARAELGASQRYHLLPDILGRYLDRVWAATISRCWGDALLRNHWTR